MNTIKRSMNKMSKWLLLLGWVPTLAVTGYLFVQTETVNAAAARKPIMVSRIYTGADGQTHVKEYEVPLAPAQAGSTTDLSAIQAAESIQFRRTSSEYYLPFHNAPRRQYVITLSGESEVEFGDGTKVRLYPGHILLAEDTEGQGHISRALGDEDRLSIFVALE
ncbi:MAG: hypothetical protein O2971_04110 [Proteobacteria bacterium]|nr:hypothetical protein [Pseudomonadota bacterium]